MKTSKKVPKKQTEAVSPMQVIAEQGFAQYDAAIKALYKAIKSKLGIAADSYITGYWHKQAAVNHELPEWEKEFDRKYADMFDVIIGAAQSYGLDPQTHLSDYFTACSIHGDGVLCRLQELLPWNVAQGTTAKV